MHFHVLIRLLLATVYGDVSLHAFRFHVCLCVWGKHQVLCNDKLFLLNWVQVLTALRTFSDAGEFCKKNLEKIKNRQTNFF